MYILSVDSGTKHLVISVGDSEKFLAGRFLDASKTHSKHIMQAVTDVLHETNLDIRDIDYFAASEGPGSFTGLRIGIATMQGFAAANNKKCLKVNTLEAMACGKRSENAVTVSLLDARNRRIYAAAYVGSREIIAARVGSVTDFFTELGAEINKLAKELSPEKIVLAGDEAREVYARDAEVLSLLPDLAVEVAPAYYNPEVLHDLSLAEVESGRILEPAELLPEYYAPTQAERNLQILK